MKTMQVFDCYEMPKDVRDAFFLFSDAGNDTYVEVSPEDLAGEDSDPEFKCIGEWLFANGSGTDEVLVKHWW